MATCTPSTVVFRSWLMSLIMTFMFDPAKLQMNCASANGMSIRRNDGASVLVCDGGIASPFTLRLRRRRLGTPCRSWRCPTSASTAR